MQLFWRIKHEDYLLLEDVSLPGQLGAEKNSYPFKIGRISQRKTIPCK